MSEDAPNPMDAGIAFELTNLLVDIVHRAHLTHDNRKISGLAAIGAAGRVCRILGISVEEACAHLKSNMEDARLHGDLDERKAKAD